MKLDFSQASIQAIGTAYWAMSAEVNTKTKQQLEAEENIGQTSDASKTSKPNSVTNDYGLSPSDNEQTVVFADPTNNNLVKINLSKENIQKLKEHFTDENNFYDRKDGSVRLNGKAEAFVSGWFGDIAYKREFLKADANGDGKLSEDEYQSTRNGYSIQGEAKGVGSKVLGITETVTETYTAPHASRPIESESIESELNFDIKADSNFDSSLTYKEVLTGSGKNYATVILNNAKEHLGNVDPSQNPFIDKTIETLKLLLEKTNNKETQKALQKLLAANGNESVLSMEEKKALGEELKAIKKQLESKDDLSSVKEEIKTKVENTQFIDVRG